MISIRFNQRYQTRLKWIKDSILLFLNNSSEENVKKVGVKGENYKKSPNKCRRWENKLLIKAIIIKSKFRRFKNRLQRQKIKNKEQMNRYTGFGNSWRRKWITIIKNIWIKFTVARLRWKIPIMLIILDLYNSQIIYLDRNRNKILFWNSTDLKTTKNTIHKLNRCYEMIAKWWVWLAIAKRFLWILTQTKVLLFLILKALRKTRHILMLLPRKWRMDRSIKHPRVLWNRMSCERIPGIRLEQRRERNHINSLICW